MTTNELPRLFTLREVSEQTGFALRKLQNDCRAGRVAHVYRGRDRFMTPAQVAALIQGHTHQPDPTLEDIALAARDTADRERLDRILAREARRNRA